LNALEAAGWTPGTFALLAAITFVAYAVHAMIGFASTVIAVTLASLWFDIPEVLPPIVAVSVVVNGWLVWRYRRDVDVAVLVREVLPWMGGAAVVGFAASGRFDPDALRRAFGVFVAALSLRELWALRPSSTAPPRVPTGKPPRWLLVIAGLVHGVFATGGPPLVLALDRAGLDKARLRATLCVVWLVLNIGLTAGYASRGAFAGGGAWLAAALVLPMGAAVVVGAWAHDRVSPTRFRRLLYVVLLASALVIIIR
jgi:uncharacterized membrane protein YfcA